IKLLADAVNGPRNGQAGVDALTCRIRVRVRDEDAEDTLGMVKSICQQHRGRTPLFLHLLLAEQEVVIRVRELSVEADPAMTAKVDALLGPGAVLVEYAGRA